MSFGSNSTTHQSGRRLMSVIFNNKKSRQSHFVLSRRRELRDFNQILQILHGDRGGTCHHFRSYTFLGPVHSFAARGRRKFGWKRPHRGKLFIILSFMEIKLPYLAKLCRLRTCINAVNFLKIVQWIRPLGVIILIKFQFFSVWGQKPPPLSWSRWNLRTPFLQTF